MAQSLVLGRLAAPPGDDAHQVVVGMSTATSRAGVLSRCRASPTAVVASRELGKVGIGHLPSCPTTPRGPIVGFGAARRAAGRRCTSGGRWNEYRDVACRCGDRPLKAWPTTEVVTRQRTDRRTNDFLPASGRLTPPEGREPLPEAAMAARQIRPAVLGHSLSLRRMRRSAAQGLAYYRGGDPSADRSSYE